MELTEEEVLQILKILDEQNFDYLHLEMGDLKLTVSRSGPPGCLQNQPQAAAALPTAARSEVSAAPVGEKSGPTAENSSVPAAVDVDGLVNITASMLGIFYSRPDPSDPPYVELGQFVKADDTVGLIEVMKLFTHVKAGVQGTIAQICVESGTLVEYGQTLFRVKPQAS